MEIIVQLSHSSLILCLGGSLSCEREPFCMHCLGIDVTLYTMHCFFSRIHGCGNVITEPLSSNGRLAPPPLLWLSGIMSQYSWRWKETSNKLENTPLFKSVFPPCLHRKSSTGRCPASCTLYTGFGMVKKTFRAAWWCGNHFKNIACSGWTLTTCN
jgi:hypothetical protein